MKPRVTRKQLGSFQHDFLCFFLSAQSGPVGEGTEPGGLGITSTLAILIFLSLMTASRSNVYYSIPHISVYSPWKNTVTNHQGQHGVQTCDKPGFISCLCHLSVSVIVLRAAQAHHCFAFWLVWLILSLQKNKGWRRIAPLLPSSVLSSNFTWHLLNNVFPFTSLLPFVFSGQHQKGRVDLDTACSFMQTFCHLWNAFCSGI